MSFYNQSVVAEPGDDSSFYDGGDGYSGGSGDCDGVSPCRGGSNGGDGDDTESASGHGTHLGLDICGPLFISGLPGTTSYLAY